MLQVSVNEAVTDVAQLPVATELSTDIDFVGEARVN